jgi:hypothetical protein
MVGSVPIGTALEAAQKAPTTDPAKIANAMSAAPPAVSRNASVMEMTADGNMKLLRKGTGEWTCVPVDPSTPGNDPMCLDPNAMEWLHAYVSKSGRRTKSGSSTCCKGDGTSATSTRTPISRTGAKPRLLGHMSWSWDQR